MKKLITMLTAIAMMASSAAVALADTTDNSPAVYIDDTEILFADQAAMIVDDRTLIPARGVFEALGCDVQWDGDAQLVKIDGPLNLKRMRLTIGSNEMKVFTYKTIMEAEESTVELDVPAQIVNDRTMVPFRAVSQALGHEVEWNQEAYAVLIKTATEAEGTEVAEKLSVSLSADKTEAKAGDEVVVDINIANLDLYPDMFVSGVTASVEYDKEKFTFVNAYMCDAEGADLGATGASNPDYTADSLKTVYVTINGETAMKADGAVMKLVFMANSDAKADFALVNRYNTKLGNDTTILLDGENGTKMVQGKDLTIDTTAVTVNAEAVADKTEETPADVTEEENDEVTAEDNTEAVIEEDVVEEEVTDEIVEDELVEDEIPEEAAEDPDAV